MTIDPVLFAIPKKMLIIRSLQAADIILPHFRRRTTSPSRKVLAHSVFRSPCGIKRGCIWPGRFMHPIRLGTISGLLIAGAGLMTSRFTARGAIGRIFEFILTASAAIPSVLAEMITAQWRLSPSIFPGISSWIFIFCFWALTGAVFGWLFATKSRRVRVLVIFLLAGIAILYCWGAVEFKKKFQASMSYSAEYLKNDASWFISMFKAMNEERAI